jgi:hypothetical protein
MHIAPIKSGVFAPVVLLTRMKSGHPRDINFNNPGLVLTIKAIITIIRRLINNFMCPPGLYVFITPGRQNKCDPRAPLNEHHLFIRINFKRVRSTPFYINGESVVAPRVILKKFVNSDLITKLGRLRHVATRKSIHAGVVDPVLGVSHVFPTNRTNNGAKQTK